MADFWMSDGSLGPSGPAHRPLLGNVDRGSSVSLERQVAALLHEAIAAGGDFGQGRKLPSANVLARHYGVAKDTVLRALRRLADADVVRLVDGAAYVKGIPRSE